MLTKAHFVLSKSKVLEKYNEMKELADTVSYSYKTNFDIGKVLKDGTECMFSIHSIESLAELNVPERSWFFAQAWSYDEIELLFNRGVDKFVVDNENDLNLLIEYLDKNQKKLSLLLRMKLKEYTIHTGKHFVYGMYSKKINRLIPRLSKNKNILNLGIHFHRKTQNVSEWNLKEELNDSIGEDNWKHINIVNIGGGIPSKYKNFRVEIMDGIFEKIFLLRKWLYKKNIEMIIEPGRYIASYPVKLKAKIKSIYDNNIIVDCSVYNAAMDTFVANIRLLVEDEVDEKEGQAYTIKGCTPDSMDIFRYRVYLQQPKVGDDLVFLNAGAYNYRSDFCNLPKLETNIVK